MRLIDDIQYSFVAGELSPTLYGHADLDKYDLGLALARNYFVDYRGGLSTRPGSIFVDFVKDDDKDTKFIPFKFAPALASTYVMLFGHRYIRFVQDGAYVLEAAKVITGLTTANPAVVTSVAHGFANGDWIKLFDITGPIGLNQQTYIVTNVTANTFRLTDTFGNVISTIGLPAYIAGGNAYRIYTVVTTYDAADLELLRARQSRSQITLTHNSYASAALIRITDTNWTLTSLAFGNVGPVPTTLAMTSSAVGTAGVGFTVTALDQDGNESLPAPVLFNTAVANIVTTAGTSLRYTWSVVPGASSYRVYRTQIVPNGVDITRSAPLGFVGMAYGPEFVDANFIPDFAITPPMYQQPFANGAIDYINVTAPGAGYSRTSTVSASIGTGFVGEVVVNNPGNLLGIIVRKGGSGYTGATVLSVSGGAGAAVSVFLTPASGNNPAVSTIFQQRQVFLATLNDPLTLWASRPKKFENFDVSQVIAPNDSYSFELDSEEVAPIRHAVPTRQGLALFSQAGIWRLSSSDGIVRATDALADPETYVGASLIPPLVIDTDLVYIEGKGEIVRLLTYSDYQKLYLGQNLSILSSHLTHDLVRWTYASDPFKLIQAVRTDGAMLAMAFEKEQQVFAWTQYWTKGLYKDVLALQENLTDTVYTMVQRYINGRWTKMIEQQAQRRFINVEESWCVDCGLANPITTPAATLTASAASGLAVTFTASAAVFAAGDVNSVLRVGGGLAIINTFTDTTHVIGNLIRPITATIQEDPLNRPLLALAGDWTLDKPFTSFGGLNHLEGETVSILADGAVVPQQMVVGGKITLTQGATRVIVGLPYTCIAKALAPNVTTEIIEDKLKKWVRSAVRLNESRGLKVGDDLDSLVEIPDRTTEGYNVATQTSSGIKIVIPDAAFREDNSIYYVQDYPLPATILGWVHEIELGQQSGQ